MIRPYLCFDLIRELLEIGTVLKDKLQRKAYLIEDDSVLTNVPQQLQLSLHWMEYLVVGRVNWGWLVFLRNVNIHTISDLISM
jgi:hypothetical protein